MADARALLRAHRAENRIKHPYAAYSEAGKLLCKLCRDAIKTESLWDAHVRSAAHRARVQALQQQPSPPAQATDDGAQKRKRSEDADESMSDAEEDAETTRTKRNKTDAASNGTGSGGDGRKEKEKTLTPPGLARRTSGTPIQGVEIAIPSRPATPLAGSNSTVSTPKTTSIARAALFGSETSSISGASSLSAAAVSRQLAATSTSTPVSNETLTPPASKTTQAPPTSNSTTTQGPSGAVDEAEWAAFEAEMAVLDVPAPPTTAAHADAIISAPALTAAQLAAKSHEEENERRKHAAEAEIADEREDATRALEAEFEEMAELEDRVRRLKERREKLRKGSVTNLGVTANSKVGAEEKENAQAAAGDALDEDDEDEDEDEDEFDGFRFRV
ncbi:hypothetical protein F4802DRAFT_564207 [Xylaria palmicola]|nr:hypothetical protein F4802DRAFT_564207 [Xylaria palmicola]